MDELKLVNPSEDYSEQIRSFRQEFLDTGDSMDGTSNLEKYEDPHEWLAWLALTARAETCPEGLVPESQFLCVRQSDNRVVGMIAVRHALNDYLLRFGGHIGYCVRRSERRKGYAEEQLRLALIECGKLGLRRVLICCFEDNVGSRKTILSAGGILENALYEEEYGKPTERYWVDVHKTNLLVIFPGMGYTCREPLLVRCAELYRSRGYQVIPLDFGSIPFRHLKTVDEALEHAKPLMLNELADIDISAYGDTVIQKLRNHLRRVACKGQEHIAATIVSYAGRGGAAVCRRRLQNHRHGHRNRRQIHEL